MCISDATGSMSALWHNAKVYLKEMIDRIFKIGGIGSTQLCWVAYRDYSDTDILEQSAWSSDPNVLLSFISGIKCVGGGDGPEAIEVALKLAADTPGVTRVLLIGDAEPHMEGKGNVVEYHKKKLETDYIEQSKRLATAGIPVYSFYMNTSANLVNSFTKISAITKGKASRLDNVDTLIDIVSENVLDDIGGEDLVIEYRKTYHS